MSKTEIEDDVRDIMTDISDALVKVKHVKTGNVYDGLRVSIQGDQSLAVLGVTNKVEGAVRLVLEDIIGSLPVAGEKIEIDDGSDTKAPHTIIQVTKDAMQATIRLDYGDEYG